MSAISDTTQEDPGRAQVAIFDTTLRDGEQSPGISLDQGEKYEIAEQLGRLGVDVIEAGFPAASQGDFEAVQAIATGVVGPTICGLSRTAFRDIDRCWEAIEGAEKARIHVFIATSDLHMRAKLKMGPDQVKAETARAVERAASYTSDVEFSAEDASRSNIDFLCEVLQIAVDAGATTLNIPDTVGYAVPAEWAILIATIAARVRGDYILSTHCHNDLGLAVANSLAAVEAGARQIECTINGTGERAGNAALEEVVMALRTRNDHFADVETSIRTEELARTSRLVSRLTGYPVQYNKAVVGRNAFAHESGIHAHGVLVEPSTYEIMDPAAVGAGESQIVLGKHSGRHAFADTLAKMGFDLRGDALQNAFAKFKELADNKVVLTEEDLEALAMEEVGDVVRHTFKLVSVSSHSRHVGRSAASVRVEVDGHMVEAAAEGAGMVEAACAALAQITGLAGEMSNYAVSSVSGGVDALADVSLRYTVDGRTAGGRGLASDVVEASAKAFLDAANRLVVASGHPPMPRPGV